MSVDAENIALIRQRVSSQEHYDDRLVLPFDRRQKSRLRTRLESGTEVGLFLERGTVLRDGDPLVVKIDEARFGIGRSAAMNVLCQIVE